MKLSDLLSSILLFIFLTVVVAKSAAKPIIMRPRIETVNNVLVNRVCHNTRNPNLCEEILNKFRGKLIFPEPFAHANGMALEQVNITSNHIYNLYRNIKEEKSDLKRKYRNCWKKYYGDAAMFLKRAKGDYQRGDAQSVRSYASNAMAAIQSCNRELSGQKNIPSNVAGGSKKIQELCNFILVLNSELKF
ncbi:hypothetical protein ABFX02_01G011600 [Erythranthe guttata]